MEYRLALVTAPAAEPVSVAEAKSHLRISSSADDSYIGTIITASRSLAEQFTKRAFINQTHKIFFDAFPGYASGDEAGWWDGVREGRISAAITTKRSIVLPLAPLVSVSSIKSYGVDDTAYTMSSNLYQVSTYSGPYSGCGKVSLRDGQTWPNTALRLADGGEIVFVAGYGAAASDVPAPIKQAILCIIAEMYENRGDCGADMPAISTRLLLPFKLESVSPW